MSRASEYRSWKPGPDTVLPRARFGVVGKRRRKRGSDRMSAAGFAALAESFNAATDCGPDAVHLNRWTFDRAGSGRMACLLPPVRVMRTFPSRRAVSEKKARDVRDEFLGLRDKNEVHSDYWIERWRRLGGRPPSSVRKEWALWPRPDRRVAVNGYEALMYHYRGRGDRAPATVELMVRCRKCLPCRKFRQRYWQQKALQEVRACMARPGCRVWFFSGTYAPSQHQHARNLARANTALEGTDFDVLTAREQFGEVMRAFYQPECSKFLKRLRKTMSFRYLGVGEPHSAGADSPSGGGNAGELHWHYLLIETDPDRPIRWDAFAERWEGHRGGHFRLKRVADDSLEKTVWYVTKYISKEIFTRIRASQGFGDWINKIPGDRTERSVRISGLEGGSDPRVAGERSEERVLSQGPPGGERSVAPIDPPTRQASDEERGARGGATRGAKPAAAEAGGGAPPPGSHYNEGSLGSGLTEFDFGEAFNAAAKYSRVERAGREEASGFVGQAFVPAKAEEVQTVSDGPVRRASQTKSPREQWLTPDPRAVGAFCEQCGVAGADIPIGDGADLYYCKQCAEEIWDEEEPDLDEDDCLATSEGDDSS